MIRYFAQRVASDNDDTAGTCNHDDLAVYTMTVASTGAANLPISVTTDLYDWSPRSCREYVVRGPDT